MRLVRIGASLLFLSVLTACGANGVLGLNPKPDGNIVVTSATNGATLTTTAATPFVVNGGVFTIGITENNFSGPYNVTVVNWTAPFNIPCFAPHYVDSAQKTNVVQFLAVNATPLSDPTQPSPCNAFYLNGAVQYDEETVRITDNDGHVVNFYYRQ